MKNTFRKILQVLSSLFSFCINTDAGYKHSLEENIHKINDNMLTKLHLFKSYNKYNKIHTLCAYLISVIIMCSIDLPIAIYSPSSTYIMNSIYLTSALAVVAALNCFKTFASISSNNHKFFKDYPENTKFVKNQFKIFMVLSFITVNFIAIIAMHFIVISIVHEQLNYHIDDVTNSNITHTCFYLLFWIIAAKYSTVLLKATNEVRWHSKII